MPIPSLNHRMRSLQKETDETKPKYMKADLSVRADAEFYRVGKWAILPVLLAGFWFSYYGHKLTDPVTKCRFLDKTGFPCPGCGGTHAILALFHGHFLMSLKYHAAVPYMALAYLHFMGLYFVRRHITRTIDQKPIKLEYYVYGLVAVILLQWFVKLAVIFLFIV